MQKRSLVIFSLIIISILLIAGCQEAVGEDSRSRKQLYSATDSTYTSTKFDQTRVNVGLGGCYGTFYDVGYVYVDKICYSVKGCIEVSANREGGYITSRLIPVLVRESIEIPCAQNSHIYRITRKDTETATSGQAIILN